MNVFDIIKDLSFQKKDIVRNNDNIGLYESYLINKAFSYYKDTIMYANEMNQYSDLPKIMQNDYYINSIRPAKRFSKWHKKIEDEDINAIQEYYKVGYAKASEYKRILTKEQLATIKERIIKGG